MDMPSNTTTILVFLSGLLSREKEGEQANGHAKQHHHHSRLLVRPPFQRKGGGASQWTCQEIPPPFSSSCPASFPEKRRGSKPMDMPRDTTTILVFLSGLLSREKEGEQANGHAK